MKLSELIKQCVQEVLAEEGPNKADTSPEEQNLLDLQKRLKGLNALLNKVPDDVKVKVKAKITKAQKDIENYILTLAGEDDTAKVQASKDISK